MAKFTNYTAGPKGVHTTKGLVYVEAGKSAELDVSEGELAAAKATGWFDKHNPLDHDDDGASGGSKPGQGDELADKTVAELKAIAEAEAVDLGDATKKADIIAAIELAREEKAKA
ncbi:hypothetical protein [Brevundimonas sp. GCM10030266]|uniref:hypothetical protein n=1 Tax=Brevundimonas sp. GCM10030266 TaxID=3273386 RepID=UPI00361F56DB